jgi:hypothetical protein
VAGRWAGAPAVLVRPCPSLRGGAASRSRPRSANRHSGARACRRRRLLRRHGADGREDGVDPDILRLHVDPGAPRVDRRPAERIPRRGCGGGNGRTERPGRPSRAVRLLRGPHHERRPGVRGSAPAPAGPSGVGDSGQADRDGDVRRRAARGCPCGGRSADGALRVARAWAWRLGNGCSAGRQLGAGSSPVSRASSRTVASDRVQPNRFCRFERAQSYRSQRRPRPRLPSSPPAGRVLARRDACTPRRGLRTDDPCNSCDLALVASGRAPRRGRSPCFRRTEGRTGMGDPIGCRCRRRGAARRLRPSPAPEAARHPPYHGFT